jgi:hypothetical protein
MKDSRRTVNYLTAVTLVLTAATSSAHHSVAVFYDRSVKTEVEGVVTSVFWRNPHIGITLLVENEQGEAEQWQLEGGTFNDLMRTGFDTDSLNIGDRIHAAGSASRRGENALYLDALTLSDGVEIPLWGTGTATTLASEASEDESSVTNIFRVWSNGGGLYSLRAPLALTPTAEAAIVAWDPLADDPGLRCEAPGMPNAILNPYPIEFVDAGDTIEIHIEEWDAVRTVYMNVGADEQVPAPSSLGYSVGRWEGSTLIVETSRINWPYLDDKGAPQSENVLIVERFTLSENDTRLVQEIVVTDPEYLVEPAIWDAVWAWKPGVQIRPFECTLR